LLLLLQVNPLQTHAHSAEGFAVDWSRVKAGQLATGDCRKHIHVWEPQEAGRWQVRVAALLLCLVAELLGC
jgi:ribosome assembly protein RRB1